MLEFKNKNFLNLSDLSDSPASFYPISFDDPTSELNKLGDEGWELVSTYTTIETKFPNFGNKKYVVGIRDNTRTEKICFVFKRKKITKSNNESNKNNTMMETEAVVEETAAIVVESADGIDIQ